MNTTVSRIKYPLFLFIGVILFKLGYIVVESYYNYYVLTITTGASLTKETLDALNTNGHLISATGITLLLFPFLYFISNRLSSESTYIVLVFLSVVTFSISYQSLNAVVDKIVEENKEKRHDAYYVNVFKYGVLNNIFVYDSFVDSKKIQTNSIDVNDRILLTNTFLLLHADEKLISKLKERGKAKVADLYISQNLQEDFTRKKELYKQASIDISHLWNEINKNKIKIRDELAQLEFQEMNEAYILLVEGLKKAYYDYASGWKTVNEKIAYYTIDSKVQKLQKDLKKYFRYKRFPGMKRKYKKKIVSYFGHYIEPNDWKDANGNVSEEHVKTIIIREIMLKVDDKLKNLPENMNVEGFMYHYETRYSVMSKLKEKDILVPYEFDYSLKEFKKYFKIMSSKKYEFAYDKFYTKLEEKIGENDIKLSMDFKEFLHSDYIVSQLKSRLETEDKEQIQNILDALYTKDLANFRAMVYLPVIKDKIEAMNFKEEDFKDCEKAAIYGEDAIKLLYIPPFALSISMIALLLNIITVFGMLMTLFRVSHTVADSLKIVLVTLMIVGPLYYKAETVNNHLLNQTTPKAKVYINFLAWISYYEKQNSLLHESNILPKFE